MNLLTQEKAANEVSSLILGSHYETARRAYGWISMSPERINVKEHSQELESDLLEIPAEDHSWYTEKYISHYLGWLSSKSRTASSMVTGPANFPVARNQKALNAEHNKYEAFQEWREKAKTGIRKRIEYNKPEEVKRDEKWQNLKDAILDQASTIVGIDAGTMPYSRPLFVASIYGKVETMAKNAELEIVEQALSLLEELNKAHKKAIITTRHKIWNLREIAFDIKQAKDNPKDDAIYPIDGGNVIVNYAEDRIQVKHDDKPGKEVIDLLKKNSFNWSRFHGCWQRKITHNTKYAIKNMFNVVIK